MIQAFCYLALGIVIATVEIQRKRAGQPFNALSLFNGAYFLFFVFVPLNVIVLGEEAVRQKYAYQTWSHGDVWTALSLLLAYVLFVAGYRRHGKNRVISGGLVAGPQASLVASRMAVFFVLIGMLALAYHVSLMGGVAETLYHAPGARSGEFSLEGNFLFFRQFSAFLATAFMLYWAVSLDANLFEKTGRAFGSYRHLILALLGVVFVYYALSTYGRREFLYPIMACFIVWSLSGRHRLWGGLGWLLALCLLWFWIYSFVIPASVQSASVQSASAQPASVQLASAFNFVWAAYIRSIQGLGDSFMHFVAAEHATLWQFGFLTDLWEIPSQFLPSQVLGFDRPRGMLRETSEFILGRPLEPGLSGEEPLGLHGYLLVNFAYPGMFLFFYLAGLAYRALDAAFRPPQGGSAVSWLVYTWAIIGALAFFREGALVFVLKPHFSWWLAIVILIWFERRRKVKFGSVNFQ